MQDLAEIWREVSHWPPEQRFALATRLLQSLQEPPTVRPVSDQQRAAMAELIGIWKMEHPPSDQEVARMVEQARRQKYG